MECYYESDRVAVANSYVDPVESSGLSVVEMIAAINASARRRARVADGLESDSSGDTHVEMTEEEEDEMLLKLLPTLFMARAVDKYLADSCWYWYRVQGWKESHEGRR